MWQLKKSNYDKTQKLALWQYSKTQILTKLKNSNCDKTQKYKFGQILKIKIVTKPLKKINCYKTQIVPAVILTVVTEAVVTVVILTSWSKNNMTLWQPMRCSRCSFSRFSRCFAVQWSVVYLDQSRLHLCPPVWLWSSCTKLFLRDYLPLINFTARFFLQFLVYKLAKNLLN